LGKILLVNTGPTEYERYGPYPVIDGSGLDAPVSDWADAAAQRLSEYKLAAVYYLPVPSGLETADAIAHGSSLEPHLLPGFEDAARVQWKGLSPEEAAVMDCSMSEKESRTVRIKFPFAADLGRLREMLGKSLDGLAGQYKKETIAIVSHRALTVVMVLHFLDMGNGHYDQIAQESGAVNLFETRGGTPSALYINDICHLKGLL
jgi:broad specificity phosphatase PhoE